MKAYLIARVSTEDQLDALPAQVHRLLDYAARRAYDYQLIEFQESAYKGERDEFRTIIEQIKANKETVIVVFDKIDRYTRDSSAEEVRMLQNLYRGGAIELHFPSDNLVVSKDSPATDIMRLGLGVVLAQYYSDTIRDNVKRRFEQMLRDGIWIGKAPYGYKNVLRTDGRKWIEVDHVAAEVVIGVYRWYASGTMSLRVIRKQLITEYNVTFSTSYIDKLLHNPFYKGEMVSNGKAYPHKYETIIYPLLFEQAKAVREGYKIEPKRWAGLPYAYRGLIRCATCNCRVTFEQKKGRYVYGHCTQTKGRHGAAYVPEQQLTEQLAKTFASIHIPNDIVQQVSDEIAKRTKEDSTNKRQLVAQLTAEIAKYQNRIERIYEDYIDEKIPENLYSRKTKEYEQSRAELKNRLEKIELGKQTDLTSVNYLLNLANRAEMLFEKATIEQKRQLINLVHSNLQLDNDLLRWEYNKPFDTVASCVKTGKWCPRQDSNLRP
jgi:site-specific DNA recombinase